MKVHRLIALASLAVLVTLGGCSPGSSYTIQKLPSGKELKVVSVGPVFFTDDETALMLRYQTDISIDDVAPLQLEAQEIWPVFRLDVERAGKNIGILQAQGPKEQVFGPLVTTNRNYSFIWTRESTGAWRLYEKESEEGDDGL